MITFEYVTSADFLRLQGVHYKHPASDTVVLCIHGMSGNFIENYFANVLGKHLSEEHCSFIYAHNRGYNHTNDIVLTNKSPAEFPGGRPTARYGVTFEIFEDCLIDLTAWVQQCLHLSYKKIILMGHSLGCNKLIYFYHKLKPNNVIGVILASPPDLHGLITLPKFQKNSADLFAEAEKNVNNGEPRKILSEYIWRYYKLSSATFLSFFSLNSAADNLPLWRNPERYDQLAEIKVPVLALLAEHDDIIIRSKEEDLSLIKSKALSCPNFSQAIIPKAGHVYDCQEESLAKQLLAWIKSL